MTNTSRDASDETTSRDQAINQPPAKPRPHPDVGVGLTTEEPPSAPASVFERTSTACRHPPAIRDPSTCDLYGFAQQSIADVRAALLHSLRLDGCRYRRIAYASTVDWERRLRCPWM